MILVDLSQLMISNVMMSIKNAKDLDESFVRHMILNSIRNINVKFGRTYGEIVIACDSGSFWRRDAFQYYKAGRKKAREDTGLDWKRIFEILNKIKEEINENFPYRVIEVNRAEADDVIAVLAAKDSIEHINNNNRILIVSGDKDFIQLQRFPNVEQYDLVNKKKVVHNNPYLYLKEHIIRGDIGDGVPNMLSPDNSLIMGIRQKPITKKLLEKAGKTDDPKVFCESDEIYTNYERNRILIDLSCVPKDIESEVLQKFEEQSGKKKSKMVPYFMKHNLSVLFANINDF